MTDSTFFESFKSYLSDWILTAFGLLIALAFIFGTLVAAVQQGLLVVILAVAYFSIAIILGIKDLRAANAKQLPVRKALAIFSLLLVLGVGVFAAISTAFLEPSSAPLGSNEPKGRFALYAAFYLAAFFDMLPGIRFVEALNLETFLEPRSRGVGVFLVLFRSFVLIGLLGSFAAWRESKKQHSGIAAVQESKM